MTAPHILIVEDEESIAEVLTAYCSREGYRIEDFRSGQGVVEYVKEHQPDLIVLDIMLPRSDGIEVCKSLRRFSEVAIIMLTAKSEEGDRLLGLELGADDYICKPFSPKEVIARIKAVLKRTRPSVKNVIEYNGFRLSRDSYEAFYQKQNLDLTKIEFKIFWLLSANVGRVFDREEIVDNVYACTLEVNDRSIDTHIKNIRKKVNAVDKTVMPIESVYGVGYKVK